MSQNPYEAPRPAPLSPSEIAQRYDQLPWYRKSSYVSPITLLGLCCGPAILVVCIIVLTGDVYYNQTDAAGHLKKWGYANKIVAIVILAVQILVFGVRFAQLADFPQP
jgi:hypothetical protein